jgi:hypothetical protein
MRASNADREEVAARLTSALAEGRLTPQEAEERLAACYAAKYQPDLAVLVRDLPRPAPVVHAQAAPARPAWLAAPLIVHAGLASLVSVLLVLGWAATSHVPDLDYGHGGPPFEGDFFWPIFPIFWLAVSVLVHAAVRINRGNTN